MLCQRAATGQGAAEHALPEGGSVERNSNNIMLNL